MNTKLGVTGILILFVLAMLFACGGGSNSPDQPAAAITIQPTDQSVVSGTTATFTVVASNATGYQWQISIDGGGTFSDIAGAASAGYSTAVTVLADSGKQYRVVVSGSNNSVTSSTVTLTVTAAPIAPGISVHPANQTITEGQDAGFSVTATGTSLSYQWQRSTDGGGTFTDVAAATAATLNLTAAPLSSNGYQFQVLVSNVTGSITSNPATLTVNAAQAAPVFTTQPVSVSITAGQSTQFTVAVTGTPAPTLQWQFSTDGVNWSDINGATSSVFDVINAALGNNGRQFRVVATNSVSTAVSNAATLTVTSGAVAPAFTLQPADVTVTEGQNAQFTVAVSGTPAPTLQWQVSTDNGVTWSNINGETGATITIAAPPLADSGRKYRAAASNSEGNATSSAALLTVNAPSASVKIVFTRGYGIESGKDDLYLVKEDGTGETALATTVDNEFFSAMAPGGRIVYQRAAGGQLDLYSVNSGGTDLQVLANTPDYEIFSGITTSGRVIYRRDTAAGGRDLWSINADGSNPQVLASSASHEDFSVITSSGKVIYSVPQYNGNNLYIINADGTSNTPLATEPYYYKSFRGETPSGQLILDMDNGYGTGLSGVYSISAGGSATALTSNTVANEYGFAGITSTGQVIINRNVAGQRDLYGNGTVSLATSTDHESYAGSTATGQVIYSRLTTTQNDLYIVDADGSNTRQLTDGTGDDYFAALTPDGRVIYGRITAGLYDIYMVNADGTDTVPVASATDYEEYKGMTSDGRVIYERTTSNVTYLYAYNTGNNVTTPLVTSGGHAFFVRITPNGKVLFRRQSGNSDLYIINPDGTGMQALANTGNNEFFNAAFQ